VVSPENSGVPQRDGTTQTLLHTQQFGCRPPVFPGVTTEGLNGKNLASALLGTFYNPIEQLVPSIPRRTSLRRKHLPTRIRVFKHAVLEPGGASPQTEPTAFSISGGSSVDWSSTVPPAFRRISAAHSHHIRTVPLHYSIVVTDLEPPTQLCRTPRPPHAGRTRDLNAAIRKPASI